MGLPRTRRTPERAWCAAARCVATNPDGAHARLGCGHAQACVLVVWTPAVHRLPAGVPLRGGAALPSLRHLPQRRATRHRAADLEPSREPDERPWAAEREGAPNRTAAEERRRAAS